MCDPLTPLDDGTRTGNEKTPAGAGVFLKLGYLDSNQEQLNQKQSPNH
jgi:hypothetical protein